MSVGSVDRPFDEGLQIERTLLAWRRTALSFGVACAVATRILTGYGVVILALGVVGIGLAAGTYVAAARRYRRGHDQLVATGELHPSGPPAALLSLAVLSLGLACALYLAVKSLAD